MCWQQLGAVALLASSVSGGADGLFQADSGIVLIPGGPSLCTLSQMLGVLLGSKRAHSELIWQAFNMQIYTYIHTHAQRNTKRGAGTHWYAQWSFFVLEKIRSDKCNVEKEAHSPSRGNSFCRPVSALQSIPALGWMRDCHHYDPVLKVLSQKLSKRAFTLKVYKIICTSHQQTSEHHMIKINGIKLYSPFWWSSR